MTPKKPRRGRPKLPKGEKREEILTLRLRVDEVEALKAEARAVDRPLAQWLREKLFGSLKNKDR